MATAPGWYDQGDGVIRYWDGERWTANTLPPQERSAGAVEGAQAPAEPAATATLETPTIATEPAATPQPAATVEPVTTPLNTASERDWAVPAGGPGWQQPAAAPVPAQRPAPRGGGVAGVVASLAAVLLAVLPGLAMFFNQLLSIIAFRNDDYDSSSRGIYKAGEFFLALDFMMHPLQTTPEPWNPGSDYGYDYYSSTYNQPSVDMRLATVLLFTGMLLVLARKRIAAIVVYAIHGATLIYAIGIGLLGPKDSGAAELFGRSEFAEPQAHVRAGAILGAVSTAILIAIIVAALVLGGKRDARSRRGSVAGWVIAGVLSVLSLIAGAVAAILVFTVDTYSWGSVVFSGALPTPMFNESWYGRLRLEDHLLFFAEGRVVTVTVSLLLLVLGVVFVFTKQRLAAAITYVAVFAYIPMVVAMGIAYLFNGDYEAKDLTQVGSLFFSALVTIAIVVGVWNAPTKAGADARRAQHRPMPQQGQYGGYMTPAERDMAWRVAELQRWEHAYRVAHNGAAPPPGFTGPTGPMPSMALQAQTGPVPVVQAPEQGATPDTDVPKPPPPA